jgi:hypothetical protein
MSERASDIMEGQAPWRERLSARMHVMMCVHCRRYFRQLRLMIATLHRMRRPHPPVETKRVLDALRKPSQR